MMSAKSKGTATPIVPKSAVPDVSPITTTLALPDSPFPALQDGEDPCGKQYLDRIGKWYEHYYLQTFRTFTRSGIGKCMHPGYCHMETCISLLTKGIVYVPKSERARYYYPLKFVLDAIAHTWVDATAPALGALAHVQELQDANDIDVDAPRSQDWIDNQCERIERETDGLKDDLRKLSEILLNGTAKQSGEIIAAVQVLGRKVDAARGDIAAVGADAHAGRVAAETLADERTRTEPTNQRADKGKKHHKRKNHKAAVVDGVKFTAEWLAGVLNRSKVLREKGAKWMGTCTHSKIEQWDDWCITHPGERNKWGYCTELRTDADMYQDLKNFIRNWDQHWKDYKAEFDIWRKKNPSTPRKDFRFKPMRRTDIDPDRIGNHEGKQYVRPMTDNEMSARNRAMKKHGLRTHYSA